MAKNISNAAKTEAQKEYNEPIYLVTITLDDTTLRFTNREEDIEYPTGSSIIYSSWRIEFPSVISRVSFEVDRVKFAFNNSDLVFSTDYLVNHDFNERTLKLSRIFGNLLVDAADEIIIFQGEMEVGEIDEGRVLIDVLSPFYKFGRTIPKRLYQNNCPHTFDSIDCLAGKSYTNTTFTFHESAGGDYITDTDVGFLTNGFDAPQEVTIIGAANPANNGTFLVALVTANTLTLSTLAMVGGADGNSITLTKSIAHETSGTADAGSLETLLVDAALTQEDDYWNEGVVEITDVASDNYGLKRKVKDFVAGTDTASFYNAFPHSINVGDTYTITRGCYKTSKDCRNKHDNWANFGGFMCLPEDKEEK